jgi:hypothetical protein
MKTGRRLKCNYKRWQIKDLTLLLNMVKQLYGTEDFMVVTFTGKTVSKETIQVDYNLPERFDLTYKGSDNELQTCNDSQSTMVLWTLHCYFTRTQQEISHYG